MRLNYTDKINLKNIAEVAEWQSNCFVNSSAIKV